ncbi:PQQ-dependent sugar dehydrogenase [Dehalococcoidia bacterium]|nr:PQQ-dependent sugar dehydrogenase [Dehalococcoidia bacterium]
MKLQNYLLLFSIVVVPIVACDDTSTSQTTIVTTSTKETDSLITVTAGPSTTSVSLPKLRIQQAFPNLAFERLTNLAQPDDALARIFVAVQSGRILVFSDDQTVVKFSIFLNIEDRVSEAHNEEGLLGLVFDPEFKTNGYFYVYYSAAKPRRSVIARFSVSRNDPNIADRDSEVVILEIPQPAGNHNGGQLAFGVDGYLYISLGDGGKSGDPFNNGQNTGTLLGSILRIAPNRNLIGKAYDIPIDNPMVGVADRRDEIWAYGFRNPWRFSFDRDTGRLWVADVGQFNWEEINVVQKGLNYGWNVMEGAHCFPKTRSCDSTGLRLPVAEYDHSYGCSIIGGYVYRGPEMPLLSGAYVYGDFCSGKVWGLRYNGDAVVERSLLSDSDLSITSFGQDLVGNIYLLSSSNGIYRLIPAR